MARRTELERVDLVEWTPDPSRYPNGIVTRRAGRGAPVALAISILLLVGLVWARGRTAEQRSVWNSGAPVLTIVTGETSDGVVVTEFEGLRQWTVDPRSVPSNELGTRLQSRLVGACRCELLVEEPAEIPSSWLIGAAALALLAAAQVRQWARWRRVGSVLDMPPREAEARAVWLRRPIGAPQWAVEIRVAGDPPEAATVLELAGTPAWWLDPSKATVIVRGPDRTGGVTVLETDHGRAVASSAPRWSVATRSRIHPWSPRLAELLRMHHRSDQAIEIGGSSHQRVSVRDGAGSHSSASARLVFAPQAELRRWAATISFIFALVLLLLLAGAEPSVGWLFIPPFASPVVWAAVRRWRSKVIADRQPLAGWDDRRGASEAARAAEQLGFIAVALIPSGGTG